MKIIKKDLKHGKLVLRIEVEDDLYYLADIISNGDCVSSKTKRRMEIKRDTKRAERADKETVTLGVGVDSVEFDRNVDRLRVGGNIIKGPESIPTGEYHTLNLKPGMVLTIEKEEWGASDMLKVRDSLQTIKANVMLVAIEDGMASMGLLRNYGVRKLGTVSQKIAGKRELKEQSAETLQFFAKVADAIAKDFLGVDRMILAGPGFVKDSFKKYLDNKNPGVAKKTVVESVSMGGDKGLQEIVKRGIITRVVKESKIQKEIEFLNKLFEEISKDGLAAYGVNEVEVATNSGAVVTLLVLNKLLKKEKIEKGKRLENIIKMVEQTKGVTCLVSDEHDLGKQLEGLGGIAALLRYKLNG